MDRERLEGYLAEGLSLERIGRLVGRDASTVGYWVRKCGLSAVHAERAAPKGGVARGDLERLLSLGMSMREIAQQFGLSPSTVRHWMKKYGLKSRRSQRLSETAQARAADKAPIQLTCPKHGPTEYRWLGTGYRCGRCSSEAVSRRRRRVKEILIKEAGGECRLCGYRRYAGALHFHHLDRSSKAFPLSRGGATRSILEARTEAAKCILLCANCHAEVEGAIVALPGGLSLEAEVSPG